MHNMYNFILPTAIHNKEMATLILFLLALRRHLVFINNIMTVAGRGLDVPHLVQCECSIRFGFPHLGHVHVIAHSSFPLMNSIQNHMRISYLITGFPRDYTLPIRSHHSPDKPLSYCHKLLSLLY